MRCPKCGNEVDVKAMECPRCGLATPKGNKPSGNTGSLKKGTGSLRNTGKLTKDKPGLVAKYLPEAIRNSPLSKISVPPTVAVLAAVLLPVAFIGIYIFSISNICLNCAQVSGKFITDLSINNKPVRCEVKLQQYQAALTGQVLLLPPAPEAPMVAGDPAPGAVDANQPQPVKRYIENIQLGNVENDKIFFQTYGRGDNVPRVQFTGQLAQGNTLRGNLRVTIPELECNGQTFSIAAQKK